MNVFDVCITRAFLGLVACYIIAKKNKLQIYQDIPPSKRKWVFLRAFLGVFYFISYTYSMGTGSISTVFLAQNISPMITSIAAFYLFQETLTKRDVVCLIMSFVGILLMLLPRDNNSQNLSIFQLLIIVTLPFHLSSLQIFMRQMKDIHYSIINFYYTLFTTVLLFVPWLYSLFQSENLGSKFTFKPTLLLILTGLFHVVAIIAFTLAFQKGKVGKVVLLTYTQLVYSMLCDILIFDMKFNWI